MVLYAAVTCRKKFRDSLPRLLQEPFYSEQARDTGVHRAFSCYVIQSYFAAASAAARFCVAVPPRCSRSLTSVAPLPRRLRK